MLAADLGVRLNRPAGCLLLGTILPAAANIRQGRREDTSCTRRSRCMLNAAVPLMLTWPAGHFVLGPVLPAHKSPLSCKRRKDLVVLHGRYRYHQRAPLLRTHTLWVGPHLPKSTEQIMLLGRSMLLTTEGTGPEVPLWCRSSLLTPYTAV